MYCAVCPSYFDLSPTEPYCLRGKDAFVFDFASRCRAQKMSHLTSRPFVDLVKLATSLEDMAFKKAAGSQVGKLPSHSGPS